MLKFNIGNNLYKIKEALSVASIKTFENFGRLIKGEKYYIPAYVTSHSRFCPILELDRQKSYPNPEST